MIIYACVSTVFELDQFGNLVAFYRVFLCVYFVISSSCLSYVVDSVECDAFLFGMLDWYSELMRLGVVFVYKYCIGVGN